MGDRAATAWLAKVLLMVGERGELSQAREAMVVLEEETKELGFGREKWGARLKAPVFILLEIHWFLNREPHE